jgi:hypothetical protein
VVYTRVRVFVFPRGRQVGRLLYPHKREAFMRAFGLVGLVFCLVFGCGGEGEPGTSGADATSGDVVGSTPDGEGDVVDEVCTEVVGCHGEAVCAEQIGDGICNWSLVCAEHELDGGDCCEGEEAIEGCDDGYYYCPAYLSGRGDGSCNEDYDCERLDYDGGDCSCPEGETLSWCRWLDGEPWGEEAPDYGTCKPTSGLGDSVCNPWFDCEAHSYDGKDCEYDYIPYEDDWCTAVGMVMDCLHHSGNCLPIEYAQGLIGDGFCNFELKCEQWDWDGGDCDGSYSEIDLSDIVDGYDRDCHGNPVPSEYVSTMRNNGICDLAFNCDEWHFDDRECLGVDLCAEGEVVGCDGTCMPTAALGDGKCDANLDCSTCWEWSEGEVCEDIYELEEADCEVGSLCESLGLAMGCWSAGICVDPELIGDGVCNPSLHCPELEYDGGDCWDAAWCADMELWVDSDGPGIVGCYSWAAGALCNPLKELGDGLCDWILDCEHHDYDAGDCSCDDPDQIVDCNGVCTDVAFEGDGICDGNIAGCLWDGDDCSCEDDGTDPWGNYERDCAGTCVSEDTYTAAKWEAWDNDVCDQAFNCHVGGWDGGDCGTGSTRTGCEKGLIPNCDGVCGDRTAIGDGTCDEAFNCWSFGYDARDCPQP